MKKGTQRVRTRYDAALLPFISIARCPGRLVIPVPDLSLALSLSLSLSPGSTFIQHPLKRGFPKGGLCRHDLRTLFPLTAFKNARNPKFVQNLSQRLVWGVPVRGTEIWKNLSKIVRKLPFLSQISDKFFQISVPLTGTPQNNRWDKFWTNLGFRAFLKAVRGKRVVPP